MMPDIWTRLDALLPMPTWVPIGTRVKIMTPLLYADYQGEVVDHDPIAHLYEVLLWDDRRVWFRREEFEVLP
jgi:hypothetical protein